MKPFYEKLNFAIPSTDLAIVQKEVRRLWDQELFIMREISPPAMYGVALYSCGNEVLNNFPSYSDPQINKENATWTPASKSCPTLVNYLKRLPYSWRRVILWNCLEGYHQPWHQDDTDVIVHASLIKPHPSHISGCAWQKSDGSVIYDDVKEGEFFLFNPRKTHTAHNHSKQHRYEITGFINDDMSQFFQEKR